MKEKPNLFIQYLENNNVQDITLLSTDEKTHTAQDAARTYGVPVSNIVKSLLTFNGKEFVIYLVPGDKKLDLGKIGARMATADEVKQITGYSIGGVPPFGHKNKLKISIEEGFDKKHLLLAAGGKPNIIFKITLEKLLEIVNK